MEIRRVVAAALLAAVPLVGAANPASAILGNEVISTHIKEADGTSGQNTNAGAGIKTNHIQNSAVTSLKIKDGGVTAADLATGAVTSAKIQDGGVTGADLAVGAVGSAAIADEAVDGGKIADGSITGVDLAHDSVSSANIVNGSIGSADLSTNAVLSATIENGAIVWEDIAMGAVNSYTIQDGGIFGADLADGSVDGNKIADGSIYSYDLAGGAVTSEKIWPGAVTGEKIADGAVGSAQILDGSVTAAKLATGAVGAAALVDGSVGNAALADGAVSTAKIAAGAVDSRKIGFYSHVFVVDANGGGDFTSLPGAMTAVAGMGPSAIQPILVKIMPGVYDVGPNAVTMVPHVDIEGSGEGTTLITGAVPTSYPPSAGTVVGSDSAEIRFLSIVNSTTGPYTAGFVVPAGTSPSLLHVSVAAHGFGLYSLGVFVSASAQPRLTHVTATATRAEKTYAVYSDSASPLLTEVTATATGGTMWNFGIALFYDGAPVLRRVTAKAQGASSGDPGGAYGNVGISVAAGAPTLTDTVASASGSLMKNVGIRLDASSEPVMTNVTASGTGAGAYGLENASAGEGVLDDFLVRADRCTFEGTAGSVRSDREYRVLIGASRLAGGPVVSGGGTLKCVASYDADYNPLLGDCTGCLPALGYFELAGPFADINACVDALIAEAVTRCCSGLLNPAGGFVYTEDPQQCQGYCK